MHTQNLAHARISVPADSLSLITALVIKLGGHVLDQPSQDNSHGPIPGLGALRVSDINLRSLK
jgi:hypothetical protein